MLFIVGTSGDWSDPIGNAADRAMAEAKVTDSPTEAPTPKPTKKLTRNPKSVADTTANTRHETSGNK